MIQWVLGDAEFIFPLLFSTCFCNPSREVGASGVTPLLLSRHRHMVSVGVVLGRKEKKESLVSKPPRVSPGFRIQLIHIPACPPQVPKLSTGCRTVCPLLAGHHGPARSLWVWVV